jgi:hypothetical protein
LVKTLKVAAPPRLSIGSAGLDEVPEHTVDALLEEADKRLYAVKGKRKREPLRENPKSECQNPKEIQISNGKPRNRPAA